MLTIKESKGITLIALVITIIVMLILAAVTISIIVLNACGMVGRNDYSTGFFL